MSRARMLPLVALIVSGGGGLACGFAADDVAIVPARPTFRDHVLPIYEDHCVLCHGARPSRGAPDGFRLDVYRGDGRVHGAADVAASARQAVRDDEMPPAARWGDGLGPNAKEVLERWVDQGAPE